MKHEEQRARIRSLADKWLKPLGLLWWERIEFSYFDNRHHFDRDSGNEALFITYADWRYLDALVEVNLALAAELGDERLELCFVHEMMHIHLDELQVSEEYHDHEERVATCLARAFLWAVEMVGGDNGNQEA